MPEAVVPSDILPSCKSLLVGQQTQDEDVASCFRHAQDRELEPCQLQMKFLKVFRTLIDHRVSEQLEPAEMR